MRKLALALTVALTATTFANTASAGTTDHDLTWNGPSVDFQAASLNGGDDYKWSVYGTVGSLHIPMHGNSYGLQLNYNKQFGKVVIGAFADYMQSGMSGYQYPCPDCVGSSLVQKYQLDSFADIGLTAGVAVANDDVLIYGFIGKSAGDLSMTQTYQSSGYNSSYTSTNGAIGSTSGIGVKCKCFKNKHISLKAEYRRLALTATNFVSSDSTGTGSSNFSFHANTAIIGISYSF